jgi:micrococcal nuclease
MRREKNPVEDFHFENRPGILSVMIIFAAVLCPAGNANASQFTGKVVGVSGGDSLVVRFMGKPQKIRLAGIDCPEPKQAFGEKANQSSSELALGKEVTVKVQTVDRLGRTWAEVILPDDTSLNRELVKAGLAWWYRKTSKDDSLGELESEAKKAKMGLWADPEPVPPWEFRKKK